MDLIRNGPSTGPNALLPAGWVIYEMTGSRTGRKLTNCTLRAQKAISDGGRALVMKSGSGPNWKEAMAELTRNTTRYEAN